MLLAAQPHIKNMKFPVMVIDQKKDEYKGKVYHALVLQDVSPTGTRLTNTFDYNLKEDEVPRVWDKFIEKRLEIAVTDFSPGFGDRLRARGHLELPAAKA